MKLLVQRFRKAMGLSWSIDLTPQWVFAGQQNARPDDGDPGTQGDSHDFDCGPTCVAMEVAYEYGSDTPLFAPDDVEDTLEQYNPQRPDTGPTTAQELQQFESQEWGINSTIYTAKNGPDLLHYIWSYLVRGHSVRVLRAWRYPGDTYLHWVSCIGLDPTHVIISNPEPLDTQFNPLPNPSKEQLRQVQSYSEFLALATMTAVGIDG